MLFFNPIIYENERYPNVIAKLTNARFFFWGGKEELFLWQNQIV